MARKRIHGVLIGCGAAVFALLLWGSGLLDRLEYATWAWRVQLFAGPGPATDKIKLILLDQASLDWGEKENGLSWPWPREVYCPIIQFCKRYGARAVVFDVLYTEPSVYGVADDESLSNAIKCLPGFVAPMCLSNQAGDSLVCPVDFSSKFETNIDNLDEWLAQPSRSKIQMSKALFPIDEVARSATMLATVTDEPDFDGIFRRAYPFRVFDRRLIPSLGLAAFTAANGTSLKVQGNSLFAGDSHIPLDDAGKMILRFRGPAGVYKSYSAAAIIQSELLLNAGEKALMEDPEAFRGSYVFLGFSAHGLLDLRPTPLSEVSPGVVIYATMLDNILSGDFIRDVPPLLAILATLLLCSLASSCVVGLSRKVRHSVFFLILFLAIPAAVGAAAYPVGFWWPVALQESAVALALTGGIVLNYATEGRQKAFIKRAFRHYLSPAVIERILENPSHLTLGGERRELTIFFSDLQGFSTISEALDPEALTRLLNDYLSDMTDIILEEGGTLDKYEGDAIIAFWNAPLSQPDHAERACRAALRCQFRLSERRSEFKERTGFSLHARIGLNTGEVVVGNMGSRSRFDYTVMGDAVNLASRLEGANKAFGTFIMISEDTWSRVPDRFIGRELGRVKVVGRNTPIRVYELLDFPRQSKGDEIEEFERALKLCSDGRWAEALSVFTTLRGDPVAEVYAHRCRALLDGTLPSWDNVWNLTEK